MDGILCDATRPEAGVPVPADGAGGKAAAEADGHGEPAAPPATWTYWDQPDGYRDPERPGDRLPTQFPYLAYLKVWERTVTAAEDPALREVALGSAMPDTAARAKVVWQVLPLPGSALELEGDNPPVDDIRDGVRPLGAEGRRPGVPARGAQRAPRPRRRRAVPGHAGRPLPGAGEPALPGRGARSAAPRRTPPSNGPGRTAR